MKKNALRSLPSVDRVLRELGPTSLPRPLLVAVVRRELDSIRKSREVGGDVSARIVSAIADLQSQRLCPVINATGILIHTNFGRSPIASQVLAAMSEIAGGYSNLEFDLTGGNRGGRAPYLEAALCALCRAEAATVVNNCAAALVLVLRHFAGTPPRNEVVISRGELVQIGGGFRIPEILESSGAVLREVGTTNKTTLSDYTRALSKQSAMILRVHRSNFFMDGFVEAAPTAQIAAIARKRKVPFVEDLGSGATDLLNARLQALESPSREPTPAEVLAQGVDLVTFSGDKLLGGPQAGIIAGRARLIAALKKNPLFRALRCDKLILGGLQTLIDGYLRDEPHAPLLDMLGASIDSLRERATRIAGSLESTPLRIVIGQGKAMLGGGSLPQTVIPSVTLDLTSPAHSPAELAQRLRSASPPVIGYISGGKLKLDLRTVFAHQDAQLIECLRSTSRSRDGGA